MTPQQIIDAWNAQADAYNQWNELSEDEKLTWAFKCASTRPEQKPSRCKDLTCKKCYPADFRLREAEAKLKEKNGAAHGIKEKNT